MAQQAFSILCSYFLRGAIYLFSISVVYKDHSSSQKNKYGFLSSVTKRELSQKTKQCKIIDPHSKTGFKQV
jgi:hypothetical protein